MRFYLYPYDLNMLASRLFGYIGAGLNTLGLRENRTFIFKGQAVYMKLQLFRWVIVVVLVIGAFLLGIEYQKFTYFDACLEVGKETTIGDHRICVSKEN